MDVVRAARAAGHGVLICSTHVPLFDLILPVLSEAACAPDLTLADAHNLSNGRYQIPAASGTVAGAPTGPSVLLRLRTELRAGGMVSCLLDRELDGPVFGNVLRLAAKLGSSLVFSSVKLGADGVIEVGFQAAPYPACDTEAALRANLAVVESFRSSYLNSLIGIRPRLRAP